MTLDEFWDHIRATRRKDAATHVAQLVERLAQVPPDEILDFDHWWELMKYEAEQWKLWGAAYLINGGCSDDGFEYFRDWLLLQGREAFQAALVDPETLGDIIDPDDEYVEHECRPGWDAWFMATNTARNEAGYDRLLEECEVRHPGPYQERDMGERWDFDDDEEVRKRFPRLAKMYLERD